MSALNTKLLLTLIAGGGGHHAHINWWVLGSTIANAVIFFSVLFFVLRPHVKTGLKSRRVNMEKALEEARLKQEKAEAQLKEYSYKLDHLEDEVDRIVGEYEARAQADKKKLEDEANRAIERLKRETETTIRQEVKKAEASLQGEALQSTLEAAARIVKERITDADQRRLVDQYVRAVDQDAGAQA